MENKKEPINEKKEYVWGISGFIAIGFALCIFIPNLIFFINVLTAKSSGGWGVVYSDDTGRMVIWMVQIISIFPGGISIAGIVNSFLHKNKGILEFSSICLIILTIILIILTDIFIFA